MHRCVEPGSLRIGRWLRLGRSAFTLAHSVIRIEDRYKAGTTFGGRYELLHSPHRAESLVYNHRST